MTINHNKYISQYNRDQAPKNLTDHMFYGLDLDPDQIVFRDAIWNPKNTIVLCDSKAGSGKAQPLDTVIPTPNGPKYLGSIRAGEYVFDRLGQPTRVLAVFPQGKQRVYKVTFSDGRSTLCAPDHLWTYLDYWNCRDERPDIYKTATTEELCKNSLITNCSGTRYKIPNNYPVQYDYKNFVIDPYVVGVFIGDGCCLERSLAISNPEYAIVEEVANLLNIHPSKNSDHNYTWYFRNDDGKLVHTKDVFGPYSDYIIQYSMNKRIPPEYMLGSIDQRFALMQGLFDTDGTIQYSEGRYNVTYSTTSYGLAEDIRYLAFSLGLAATIHIESEIRCQKYRSGACYNISILVPNEIKPNLFRKCSKKYSLALESTQITKRRHYEYVGIISIEDMGYETDMVCIYVDNPEHLYLTNDFIVTHNTTIAVATANLLVQYGLYNGIVYVTFPVQEHVLGYLPGTEEEKIAPYRQPLEDALLTLGIDPKMTIVSEDNIQALKEGRAYIDFCADTFMRGINLEHKVVIIDEAANAYFDQLKKVLTRIHDNSKCICIGSHIQCDIVKHSERSGFIPYLEAFRKAIANGETRAQICELTHNHRGWLSNFCDDVMFAGK